MTIIKSVFFNPLQARCIVFVPEGSKQCAVVDPGASDPGEQAELFGFLDAQGLRPEKILLTHGHFDHFFAVSALRERYGCPVLMHPADAPLLRQMHSWAASIGQPGPDVDFPFSALHDGERIPVGGSGRLEVIATPGHSPGSVCFYDAAEGVLLSGDTLFNGTIGRSDLPGGDYDALIRSVTERLMGLPGETTVLPGHGSPTTIGHEAGSNPFLVPFNEPESASDWTQDGISLDNGL